MKQIKQVNSFCQHCGKTPNFDGPAYQMCSRCKGVRYCSKECQRADWKEHKSTGCFDFKQAREEDAKLCGGIDFVKCVDNWRAIFSLALNGIAKGAIGARRRLTHVVLLSSNFKSDREGDVIGPDGTVYEKPKVVISEHAVVSVEDLKETSDVFYESFRRSEGSHHDKEMYTLFHIVRNLDDPLAAPLLRMSHLGTDLEASKLKRPEQYITEINTGFLDLRSGGYM